MIPQNRFMTWMLESHLVKKVSGSQDLNYTKNPQDEENSKIMDEL